MAAVTGTTPVVSPKGTTGEIRIWGSRTAFADRLLERIFINLLSNALKYSAPGTPVIIRAQHDDGLVRISVTDEGPGIPPEELPRLFQRYYRATESRETEGIGLGLYITRLLVEAHGGRVWVESKVGTGSTFFFTLPVATFPDQ